MELRFEKYLSKGDSFGVSTCTQVIVAVVLVRSSAGYRWWHNDICSNGRVIRKDLGLSLPQDQWRFLPVVKVLLITNQTLTPASVLQQCSSKLSETNVKQQTIIINKNPSFYRPIT